MDERTFFNGISNMRNHIKGIHIVLLRDHTLPERTSMGKVIVSKDFTSIIV
jgi:hypothetical protein